MGEKGARLCVKVGDGAHVLLGDSEVKDIQVLCHPLLMCGFWKNDDTALDIPAEHDLRRCLSIFLTDFVQRLILEQVAPALAKRGPGLMDDAVFFHPFMIFFTLVQNMGLNLVHHGSYACEGCQINKVVRIEIADADGAEFSLLIIVSFGFIIEWRQIKVQYFSCIIVCVSLILKPKEEGRHG